MNEYRYKFEKGSRKHFCPACNKKRFVRYVDTKTGEYLPEQYGRCDRESKCSYHLNPYLDGYAKAIWEQEQGNRSELPNNWKPQRKKATPQPEPEPIFFDFETFKQTLGNYDKNVFIQNLLCRVQYPFEAADVTRVIQLYRLGTVANGYRSGAITFPFIDTKNNVRAIQVKQFDETNHTTGTDFLHSIIEKHHTRNNKPLPEWLEAYTKQEKRITCLFGEHLLSRYPNNPIALVEAPKTAVYGTLYFGLPETSDNLIWLAVGAKGYLNFDKIKVLQGRFVYVFPDLSKDGNTFKEWETKAKEYESRLPGTRFIFSDLLEQAAPEADKSKGNDLADFLIKLDWRPFREQEIMEQPPEPEPEPEKVTEVTKVTHQQNIIFSHVEPLPKVEVFKTERIEQPQNWSNDIAEPEKVTEVTKVTDKTNIIFSDNFDFIEWLKQDNEPLPYENEVIQYEYNPDWSNELWNRGREKEQPKNWNNEIAELESYFANLEPPTQPIKLNQCSMITDYSLFIESHFARVKANNGKRTFLPYLNRLQELKQVLTINSN